MPEGAENIISVLESAGYEAYIVGGCVRDALLGRAPDDWDITTSALPQDIKRLFRHTVDTGIEHGTVTVLTREGSDTIPYEVTTYRIDGVYLDGRHPESVSFTPSLEEDLKRRDFTINAMAYNRNSGLIDLFGGTDDLKNRIIRCVGTASDRIAEDALRMMRAVRFAAQLGFNIHDETAGAIRNAAPRLEMVSKERVLTELSKLLCSAHPEKLELLTEYRLAGYIADGFEKCVVPGDPLFSNLPGLRHAVPFGKRYLRFALMFCGTAPDEIKHIMRCLKSDNDTADKACLLAPLLRPALPDDEYGLKLVIGSMTPELFSELLDLKNSCMGQDVASADRVFRKIMENKEAVYMSDLCVNGGDLIRAGIPAGPEVGDILRKMLDEVRRDPARNNYAYLMDKYTLLLTF